MIITEAMKITKAGQVTVPKIIREILKTDNIAFEITNNNEIHLIPINSVAGSLSDFAKNGDEDFDAIREKSWKSQTNQLLNPHKEK
jgi:bifunctional DNA-binding transcriptional regulator/antitoxin component of YhaV-PrlF toxin-antitoxin module